MPGAKDTLAYLIAIRDGDGVSDFLCVKTPDGFHKFPVGEETVKRLVAEGAQRLWAIPRI